MDGDNNDGIHVYEMMNLSSGDKEDHGYETVNKNTELTDNNVCSDENTSARATQSLANVIGSIGQYHMYETVNENTEIPGNEVVPDKNNSSRIHVTQAHNGRANTCMKKVCTIILIITLVAIAGVAYPVFVRLTSKPPGTLQFCNQKQNKNKNVMCILCINTHVFLPARY
jgi:hypothetical protein